MRVRSTMRSSCSTGNDGLAAGVPTQRSMDGDFLADGGPARGPERSVPRDSRELRTKRGRRGRGRRDCQERELTPGEAGGARGGGGRPRRVGRQGRRWSQGAAVVALDGRGPRRARGTRTPSSGSSDRVDKEARAGAGTSWRATIPRLPARRRTFAASGAPRRSRGRSSRPLRGSPR